MGTDTIAAIATAMTSSGIGIVRISGDEAVSITDRIFEMKTQKKLEDMPTHTIHYGHIHDGGILCTDRGYRVYGQDGGSAGRGGRGQNGMEGHPSRILSAL